MSEYHLTPDELQRLQVDDYDRENPLRADAVVIEGIAHTGKPCRIVDNTVSVPREELEQLLATLVEQRAFGLGGTSVSGGSTITIGAPEGTHIQIGESLYRLVMFPYEARIEPF